MALPGIKQKCYICQEEVKESHYRRELTCSYTSCPGSEHAYHEECINEYLRKLKLPVDRLIGYQCPVVLDNGRPCTGCITKTHHKMPLNQKKKQKRVEAAAAAAAALKPKPQPLKSKDAKPGASGVAVAKAAMRPAGEAAIRQAGVPINVLNAGVTIVKGAAQPHVIGKGPADKLSSTATAVHNNASTVPQPVVRQRIIPGWTDPKDVAKSTREQQRAQVAALKAEARSAAGLGPKAPGAPSFSTGSSAVPTPPVPAADGWMQAPKPGTGERGRFVAAPQMQDENEDDDSSYESDESDTHPFTRWMRAGEGSQEGGTGSEEADFSLMQADFPSVPESASGSVVSTPSKNGAAVAPAKGVNADLGLGEFRNSGKSSPGDGAAVTDDSSSCGQLQLDGARYAELSLALLQGDKGTVTAAATAMTEGSEEEDPIVGHDQLFMTEDGTLVVMDAYGNYISMYDVYDQNAEMIGYQDDGGNVTYYVVVRKSHVDAQMSRMAQYEGATVLASVDSVDSMDSKNCNGGPAASSTIGTTSTVLLADTTSVQSALPAVAEPLPTTAFLAASMYEAAPADVASGGYTAVPHPTQAVPDPVTTYGVLHAAAPVAAEAYMHQASAAEDDSGAVDDGDELDDILALCTSATPPAHAASVPLPPSAYAFTSVHDPVGGGADFPLSGVAQLRLAEPGPQYATCYGGIGGTGDVTAAPATHGSIDHADAAEVNDLMQLLCV